MMIFFKTVFILILLFNTHESSDFFNDQNPQKWNEQAKQTIESLLKTKVNQNIAKNLIIFLGDGMGISTITSGRIRKGQKKGENLVKNFFALKSINFARKILMLFFTVISNFGKI